MPKIKVSKSVKKAETAPPTVETTVSNETPPKSESKKLKIKKTKTKKSKKSTETALPTDETALPTGETAVSASKPASPEYRIGRHIALTKDFYTSISTHHQTHASYGGKTNAFQLFMKSPQKFSLSKLTEDDATKTKQYVTENNLYVVSHSAYICNIGKPLDINSFQVKMVADDIRTIESIGGSGTVVHVGKACELTQEQCLTNMVEFTKTVLDATSTNKSYFILETAAGQGTEACVTIEALAEYHKRIPEKYHPRLRYCIDTCHIYAAGYDISTETGAVDYINTFDDLIGWKFVELIHFNDSKKECGCKKDRHENIGEGHITKETTKGLETFAIIASKTDKAVVLETPCSGKDSFDEIQKVIGWVEDFKSEEKTT